MDSTCPKTITLSSILGSYSPSYSTGPHSFSLDIPLKAKITTVQKFFPHSSTTCQGRRTCSPSRKALLCRATHQEAKSLVGICVYPQLFISKGKWRVQPYRVWVEASDLPENAVSKNLEEQRWRWGRLGQLIYDCKNIFKMRSKLTWCYDPGIQ